ncbi:unnamed protein product, partial [marine sediment metagenome]
WLELPGLEEKEDISDWIEKEKGNTKEKLLQLIKEAPDFTLKKHEEKSGKPINPILKARTKTIVPNLIHLVGDQGRTKYLFCKNGQLVDWMISGR